MSAKLGWLAAGALAAIAAVRPQVVSNPSESVTMGVGSTEAGKSDLLFVLYKRKNDGDGPPERLTLATYKNMSGDVRHPKMEFRGARDLSYDFEVADLTIGDNDHGPGVKELKDAWEKAHPRKPK